MQTDDLDRILEPFGEDLINDLQKSLLSKGVVFGGGQSSKLSAKIRYNIRFGDPLRFELIMPEYAEAVNSGRSPSKDQGNPPPQRKKGGPPRKPGAVELALRDWIKRKGISERFAGSSFKQRVNTGAYLIARKIHRKGYKGNHFYSEVINDGRIDGLTIQLREFFKQEVVIDILK
jgi:hypothetical protein